MATVPPADRTSPALDPRYAPVFQRGYSAERTAAAGPVVPSNPGSAPRPSAAAAASSPAGPLETPPGHPIPEAALDPVDQVPGTPAADTAPPPRLRAGILWLVSAALFVAGILLHFAFGAAGYGADWSVSTEGGAIRFADGRSVEQVLATDLAVTVAPYLVVLGIATAVATLFLQTIRSEKGTR